MKRLDGKSLDIVSENIEKLREIFPEVFSEGKVDFEKLENELGEFVDKEKERYNFTWAGKQNAKKIAQTPSTGTLRPAKEESKNWDSTQNLYIEGDNLEVLKLLQKSYHKQVKMIYIDPPYNTGKDFVYKDNFKDNIKNYLELTGQVDSEGNRLSTNAETNGRYHSDWLSMMYPRLKLARNLLKDDGVIFISIDDNEVANLRKLCDEIFGEGNFVGEFIKQSKIGGGSDSKHIAIEHEYILCYAKSINNLPEMFEAHNQEYLKRYKEEDEKGKYFWDTFARPGLKNPINYNIEAEDGTIINGDWIWSRKRFLDAYTKGEVRILKKENGEYTVHFKQYLNINGKKPRSMTSDFGGTFDGKKEVGILFNSNKIFSYPKSTKHLLKLYEITSLKNDDIVLDFFSGSATTAHAVMQLNAEDGGNRRYILVQLPELTDEKSEAFKAGYKNICEIGKERIRRAGDKIIENGELKIDNLDIGFKVFKLDSSNIKAWDSDFDNLEQNLLDAVDNIKEDRSSEDLLYEILLKYGLDLTLPIEEKMIDGKKVFVIGCGALIVCLDEAIELHVVETIAKLKEEYESEVMRIVFRDSSFKDAVVKTNALEVLKQFGIDEVVSV